MIASARVTARIGSRIGPAGSIQPLPKPRSLLTSTRSTSRFSRDVLKAVVQDHRVERPELG